MKRFSSLWACSLLIACGGASPGYAPNPSPHYDKVSENLHLGGELYFYVDVDGDLEKLTDEVTKLFMQLEIDDEIKREDIMRVLQATGVRNLQALGLSSYAEGPQFHNRAFLQFDGKREGIMKVLGGAPHELDSLRLAPTGSDFVAEQDLHLKQAYDVVMATLRAIEPKMADEIEREIDTPVPGLAMRATDILAKADTRLIAIAKLDPTRRVSLEEVRPGASLPHIDFAIGVDGYGFVIEQVADQYGQVGLFDVAREGDLLVLQINAPIPPELQSYKPVLASKGGRLWLASTRAFLDSTLGGGEKLGSDAAWQKVANGLPTEGNGLGYMSPRFFEEVAKLPAALLEQGEEQVLAQSVIDFLLPANGHGVAGVQVNGTDSLFYASNSMYSHKATMGMLLYFNPITLGILGAVALPSFMQYSAAAEAVAEEVVPIPAPVVVPPPAPPAPPAKPAKKTP